MHWFPLQILLLLSSTFKSNSQCTGNLTGSSTVDDFTITITMNCTNEKIQFDIESSNYNNNWFALVFHHHMVSHPSLVYTTGKNADRSLALYSYDLQSKTPNGVIYDPDNDWTEINTFTQSNTIRIIYEQQLSKTEWDTSITSIGFRIAAGSSLQLAMHDYKSAHTTVSLTQAGSDTVMPSTSTAPVTPQPTISPTEMQIEPGECGGNDHWAVTGTFDDFDIILTINCITEHIRINMTYHGFMNNWFGLVFNDKMEGDAVIYTTGKSGVMEPKLYFYSISGKSSQEVIYNEGLNWHEIETSTVLNGVQVIYEQHLSKTNWDFNTNEIPIRWAVGSADTLRLVHHESRSSNTKYYNFISGGSRSEQDEKSMYFAHGIIMWLAWAVFASFGIMASSFRWLLPSKPAGCWFQMHRAAQIIVLILHTIGFIIAVIFVQDSGVKHFSNHHMIMGLTVTVLVATQPLNALVRPHPVKAHEKKPMKRLVWEIMHKFLGYSAWIIGCVTAYLGFSLPMIDEPLLGYIHLFAWCLFLFIVYIVLTMIGCSRNKMESQAFSVNVINGSDIDESDQLVDGVNSVAK